MGGSSKGYILSRSNDQMSNTSITYWVSGDNATWGQTTTDDNGMKLVLWNFLFQSYF